MSNKPSPQLHTESDEFVCRWLDGGHADVPARVAVAALLDVAELRVAMRPQALQDGLEDGLLGAAPRDRGAPQDGDQRPHPHGLQRLHEGPRVPGAGPEDPLRLVRRVRELPQNVEDGHREVQGPQLLLEHRQRDGHGVADRHALQHLPVPRAEVHRPLRVGAVAEVAGRLVHAAALLEVEAGPAAQLGVPVAAGVRGRRQAAG
eukprot:CAMPEP_0179244614 /NCGR_PEP_ID=MMETSP0797-20121207/18149_1 /TAXON_ID=47934 /ORGANISM="Dinophysis acuminata, Strain DAEP01" /LENGTH=203 /DNA_ID=CAMNT_0020952137 /DNA_START=30 /DNA_END=638 /DNA_ORIENTATION=+